MLLAPSSCSLIILLLSIIASTDAAENGEPAFPAIFKASQFGKDNIHIVAESVDDASGYLIIEEYADMRAGRYASTQTDKTGQSVTFSDSEAHLAYRYRPYSCEALSFAEIEEALYRSPMNAKTEVSSSSSDNEDGETREMHLFGLIALWFNVANMNKKYSIGNLSKSVSNSIIINAHKWTAFHEPTQTTVHMYFVENKPLSGSTQLALEMIQMESVSEKKTAVKTFNILTLEYTITDEVSENLLKMPVGYGCVDAKTSAKARKEFPSLEDLYIGPLLAETHRIQFEATGTRYAGTNGPNSDTVSYELARTQTNFVETVQLMRQRDSRQDIKTILNYDANVQFKIDMRSGSCVLSNMGESKSRGERASIKFNNALELDLDSHLMQVIFVDTQDFYFIKRSSRGTKSMVYLYFERTTSDLFGERLARIVRTYSFDSSNKLSEIKLETVTIWILNEQADKVLESYHLNIVEAEEIESLYELSKVFDISEECYLSNDQMRAGRDYAWMELTYPIDPRHSRALASYTSLLKDRILNQFSSQISVYSIFLVPRLEIMFEDTSLILRLLMLDIPPLELIYDYFDQISLIESSAGGGALASDVAVDVKHCADLCRLSNCVAMTFCDSSHRCLLSAKYPNSNESPVRLSKGISCGTYIKPQDTDRLNKTDALLKLRLHQTISSLQHQNYGGYTLPRMPDELALPPIETGVTDDQKHAILLDYLKAVWKVLEAGGDRLPSLFFNLKLDDCLVMLVPSKFELEQDPLSEFNLNDANPSDDQDAADMASPFREGLSMHRYKISTYLGPNRKDARLLSGITYDQCALACVDGKCSSFSYCSHRQECILTDIYTISAAVGDSIIEQDADCFISQRDFISKFNRFQSVPEPKVSKGETVAFNPSECAHSCVVETNFRCLAFEFCQPKVVDGHESQLGKCFLLEERFINVNEEDSSTQKQMAADININKEEVSAACDHYSRSYLADFNRIEYRRVESSQLSMLKTSLVEGHSVDRCADICVNELTDCTAFEFCFDADSKSGIMQRCTLIESPPKGSANSNETSGSTVTQAGKYFEPDPNCHVFSLRRDSSEAHMRDLAFRSSTEGGEEEQGKSGSSAAGISLGGGIMLYICLTVLFAALGCGLVFAKHQNHYLRSKIERLEIILCTWKR